jgi:class 3 adenylate cyclase
VSELEEFLVSLGATPEDLIENAEDLPGLASVLFMRPGSERLSLREIAERAGVTMADAASFWRAAGLAEVDPDAKVSSDAEVAVLQAMTAARVLFGEEAMIQLSRVIGSSMARIADAAVSMFLVNLERPLHDDRTDIAMTVARANRDAGMLIPSLVDAVEVLLRRHLMAARRSLLAVQVEGGTETQRLAIGFIDLVGSTALAQNHTLAEWGASLSEFEQITHDLIIASGARLVKLIGDEVMYATSNPDAAVAVARALTGALRSHARLPPVRAGLAFGNVMTRDGDCFGPVVNVAARAVKLAEPSQVVLSAEFRNALTDASALQSLGFRSVKGIDEPLEFWTLAG